MSCIRKVRTFQEIEQIEIESCNKEEIEQIERSVISAIEQKLKKINILVRNCHIYCGNGMLLVNDRFCVCSDLKVVAEAFGLTINEISCSLKGKSYIITDKLLFVLEQFAKEYNYGDCIANRELSEEVKEILENQAKSLNLHNLKIDNDIREMVKNIRKNGRFLATRTREVTEEYLTIRETNVTRLENRSEGEWDSNAREMTEKLKKISKQAQKSISKTNEQLRDGTAKLIYSRAKQMGYAVEEVKKGKQTQLVLVRYE